MKNLIDIFNETLINSNNKASKSKEFKIKPSDLGSPCMRKIYYGASRVEPDYPFDLAGKKRLKLGDAIHSMLDEVFRQSGVLIDYVNPDGSVHKKFGFADPTTEFPLESLDIFVKYAYMDGVYIIDNELWLGEYKSINQNGFNGLTQAKPDHIIQGVTYWYIFNRLLQEGKFSHISQLSGFTEAKGVRWLYVNKDDTSLKEFTMTKGDVVFSQIVEKIFKIKDAYDTKTLPPKTEDWCKSCSFRDKCKKNFNIS